MGFHWRPLFAGFGLLAAAALPAQDRAEGTITVNGKTTRLAHAYARAVRGFFDKTKEDIEVILTDAPLEGKALADQFERMNLAKEGRLHAFEITINSEGTPISTSWQHNGFKGATPSGLSSEDVFTKQVFDGQVAQGRYASAKPREFFGNSFSFDVAFRAAVQRPPKPVVPTAAETAAALKSPQAKVYTAYLKAVQAEDLAALRNLFTQEQAKNLDDPDAKQMVKMIRMISATGIQILKLSETGDSAELTVAGKQDGNDARGIIHLAREGGGWKIRKEEWSE